MNKKYVLAKIEKNKNKIRSFKVKTIGLFGSFVKGKQNEKSDIDILVIFENKDYGDQYFELLFYLEDLFKRKIDLIPEECLRKELLYVKEEAEYVRI